MIINSTAENLYFTDKSCSQNLVVSKLSEDNVIVYKWTRFQTCYSFKMGTIKDKNLFLLY